MQIVKKGTIIEGCNSISPPDLYGRYCSFVDGDGIIVYIDSSTIIRLHDIIKFECERSSIDFDNWCERRLS